LSACLDAGRASALVHLRGLTNLEQLWLDRTKISDAGVVLL